MNIVIKDILRTFMKWVFISNYLISLIIIVNLSQKEDTSFLTTLICIVGNFIYFTLVEWSKEND